MNIMDQYVTVIEAAEELDVSPQRIRQFVKEERLKAIHKAHMWWILRTSLDAFKQIERPSGRPKES